MAAENEKAELIGEGGKFDDWTSVWVQHIWGDPYSQFRFTCAERDPTPGMMSLHRFQPDDEVTINLAGKTAITGLILTRQVAYTAHQHGIQLQGVSMTWPAARANILHKTSSFDKKNFKEIVDEVLEPTGVKPDYLGTIDEKKWEKMHTQPGDTIFSFLERIGRDRKILVTTNQQGQFLFIGEDYEQKNQGSLIEGQNIKKCQAVLSIHLQRSLLVGRSQTPGGDDKKYRKASEQEAKARGTLRHYSPLLVPLEQPVWTEEEVKKRMDAEAMWMEANQLQVSVTVQGWLTSSGRLWEAGGKVNFKSPMTMIDTELSVQSVTFEQDNSRGSETTMLLVSPHGLNGKRGLLPPDTKVPDPARVDTSPPKTGG